MLWPPGVPHLFPRPELTHLLHACAMGHLVKGEVAFVHLETGGSEGK